MPEESLRITESIYDALARRDLDGFAALLAPDVDWRTPGVLPWGGVLQGVDAVRAYVTDLWGFFGDYRLEVVDIVARDDLAVVSGRHLGLAMDGQPLDIAFADLCCLRGGCLQSWRQQMDAGLILRALSVELAA